jgi:hypothetical protein
MKAQRSNGSTAPLILNLGTRRRRGLSLVHRPPYPPIPTEEDANWSGYFDEEKNVQAKAWLLDSELFSKFSTNNDTQPKEISV